MDNKEKEVEQKKPITIFFITDSGEKVSAFTSNRSYGLLLPSQGDNVILKEKRYKVSSKTFKYIEMDLDATENIVLEIDILVEEVK